MSDRFGRKIPILYGIVLIVIGAAIQGASQNYAMLVCARLIVGFASITLQGASPILIAELAYPTHRGKLTTLANSFYFFGGVIAAWVTFGTSTLLTEWAWRLPSILQAVVPLMQLCVLYFIPESPRYAHYGPISSWEISNLMFRWLVNQDRVEEARAILIQYHTDGDEASVLVEHELQEIIETIRIEKESEHNNIG